MKHKKMLFGLMFLSLGIGTKAQQSISSGAGEIASAGIEFSYTIGQVMYSMHTGTNGTVVEGVQQPNKKSISTNIKHPGTDIDIKVYPNPVVNDVNLSINQVSKIQVEYYLFDMTGKLLKIGNIANRLTKITMNECEPGIYFLKVTSDNKTLKNIKLIKQ